MARSQRSGRHKRDGGYPLERQARPRDDCLARLHAKDFLAAQGLQVLHGCFVVGIAIDEAGADLIVQRGPSRPTPGWPYR